MLSVLSLMAAFVLDLLFGDPAIIPHFVVGIGKTITICEAFLRKAFPKSRNGERLAGVVLAILVPLLWSGGVLLLIAYVGRVHPWAGFFLQTFFCWQCLAARSLEKAAKKVKNALKKGIAEGREAVAQIVGRDCNRLNEAAVIKATVETVAENTCDGVIAPIFWIAIGGAPLGVLYKAVNTLDSMVGYKNERYIDFGCASARLDDVMNFIPARISALLMMLSAPLCGCSLGNAVKIYLRDRKNHKSPNSAQTESVCAGALGVILGGGAYYFGSWVDKPTIGDDNRPIEPQDITRTDKMMLMSSLLAVITAILIRMAVAL